MTLTPALFLPRNPAAAAAGRRVVRRCLSDAAGKASAEEAEAASELSQRLARLRAYRNYQKRSAFDFGPLSLLNRFRRAPSSSSGGDTAYDPNVKIASYAVAVVVGALGATYASVPLYKMFCQATGFGGTTQRVTLGEWAEKREERDEAGKSGRAGLISQTMWDKLADLSNVPSEMLPKRGASHGRGGAKTWTDEDAAARLASLKPVVGGRLITVRFDSTVGDVMPWAFVPAQLDVKVVPGETALSFFTATNNSKEHSITGVATYNVHPPRAGLYFNKIQCFCFEEQRLLPGETVDMPVFFFIDPEYADDPQLKGCSNITLSYTFFQTDYDDEDEDEEEEENEVEENSREREKEGGAIGDGISTGETKEVRRGWLRSWLPSR